MITSIAIEMSMLQQGHPGVSSGALSEIDQQGGKFCDAMWTASNEKNGSSGERTVNSLATLTSDLTAQAESPQPADVAGRVTVPVTSLSQILPGKDVQAGQQMTSAAMATLESVAKGDQVVGQSSKSSNQVLGDLGSSGQLGKPSLEPDTASKTSKSKTSRSGDASVLPVSDASATPSSLFLSPIRNWNLDEPVPSTITDGEPSHGPSASLESPSSPAQGAVQLGVISGKDAAFTTDQPVQEPKPETHQVAPDLARVVPAGATASPVSVETADSGSGTRTPVSNGQVVSFEGTKVSVTAGLPAILAAAQSSHSHSTDRNGSSLKVLDESLPKDALKAPVSRTAIRPADLSALRSTSPAVDSSPSRTTDTDAKAATTTAKVRGLVTNQPDSAAVKLVMSPLLSENGAVSLNAAMKEGSKSDTEAVNAAVSAGSKQPDAPAPSSNPPETKNSDGAKIDVSTSIRVADANQNGTDPEVISIGPIGLSGLHVQTVGAISASTPTVAGRPGMAKLPSDPVMRTDSGALPAPAAPPVINSARVIHSMGQTEMSVGIHSTEFGAITIRTAANRDTLVAQISTDHADLAKELAIHLPEIQEKLGTSAPANVRIDFTGTLSQGSDTSGGMSNSSSDRSGAGREQQHNTTSDTSDGSAVRWQSRTTMAAAAIQESASKERLDIRV